MLNDRELVQQHGTWDPALEAYEVIDPTTGRSRYFQWKKPWVFMEAVSIALVTAFWLGLVVVILTALFGFPKGVAGDRGRQLQAALEDRYNVEVLQLPDSWTSSQVFEVDVQQGWDDPGYDEPEMVIRGCTLRPGATAKDLLFKCPSPSGGWLEMPESGRSAWNDRYTKERQATDPATNYSVPLPPSEDDSYEQQYDPYEHYDPSLDYPGPEEMYP